MKCKGNNHIIYVFAYIGKTWCQSNILLRSETGTKEKQVHSVNKFAVFKMVPIDGRMDGRVDGWMDGWYDGW